MIRPKSESNKGQASEREGMGSQERCLRGGSFQAYKQKRWREQLKCSAAKGVLGPGGSCAKSQAGKTSDAGGTEGCPVWPSGVGARNRVVRHEAGEMAQGQTSVGRVLGFIQREVYPLKFQNREGQALLCKSK